MSGKTGKNEPAEAGEGAPGEGAPKPRFWRRWLPKRWLPVVILLTFIAHGTLWLSWRTGSHAKQEVPSEVGLGEYRFINSEANARLAQASFRVHVSLLLGTERIGGSRLTERKFLVQQGIEELLRQAHAADFDDPTLSELKRQIQEKVNEALEMRTVEAVIITDLEMENRQLAQQTLPAAPAVSSLLPGGQQPASALAEGSGGR